jgi:hypothetical protein
MTRQPFQQAVASPGGCEEASPASRDRYVPCNQPATAVVFSEVDQRDYRMCPACADHATKNRGMKLLGRYQSSSDAEPFLDADDVEAAPPPPDESVRTIANLAQEQLRLEDRLKEAEAHAAEVRAALTKVRDVDLPAAMLTAGVTEFKLAGGGLVSVKLVYECAITEENKPRALSWLRDRGLADLIKHEVKVTFGRGDEKLARRFLSSLTRRAVPPRYTDRTFVEPSTLKAQVRELVEARQLTEADYPLFSVFPRRTATVKLPAGGRS